MMETPVINKIPLLRKTLIGWIVLGIIYIAIVLFTSLESENVPQTIAYVWDSKQMPTSYTSQTSLICVTIIPSTLLTFLTSIYSLVLPFYNTKIAFIPYKKFWLSLVNIEKTSFILIWLSLFIGISSNMLSFSLFYPLWRFNMKCMDIDIHECKGVYIYIPQLVIYILSIICYIAVVYIYFSNPPKKEGQLIESGDLEEEGGWKHEVLYYNPFNPVLFVHKRLGMGWTFNWGNPWITILAMTLIMIFSIIFMLLWVFLPTV